MSDIHITNRFFPKQKDWKKGDIFAIKINSSYYKNTNVKYLLFIYDGWVNKKTSPIFRVKVVTNQNLPKSEDEINKLDFVMYELEPIELAKISDDSRDYSNLCDKYGYLHVYQVQIWTTLKKKVLQDMFSLGNYNIRLPKDEYKTKNLDFKKWEDILEKIMKRYYENNMKNSDYFNKEICHKTHLFYQNLYNISKTGKKQRSI